MLESGVQLPDGTDVRVEPLESPQVQAPAAELSPVRTGADLHGSDLIGIWADRTDIGHSREFARRLRKEVTRPSTTRERSLETMVPHESRTHCG